MNAKEVIEALLFEYRMTASAFAKSCGLVPVQIYDIQNGKIKNISQGVASKILDKYSELNKGWLLSGEGSMYADTKEKQEPIVRQEQVSSSLQLLIAEMAAQREMSNAQMSRAFSVIEKFQEQTDRLIKIIETSGHSGLDRIIETQLH
jgi:predicted transcriptional regulator